MWLVYLIGSVMIFGSAWILSWCYYGSKREQHKPLTTTPDVAFEEISDSPLIDRAFELETAKQVLTVKIQSMFDQCPEIMRYLKQTLNLHGDDFLLLSRKDFYLDCGSASLAVDAMGKVSGFKLFWSYANAELHPEFFIDVNGKIAVNFRYPDRLSQYKNACEGQLKKAEDALIDVMGLLTFNAVTPPSIDHIQECKRTIKNQLSKVHVRFDELRVANIGGLFSFIIEDFQFEDRYVFMYGQGEDKVLIEDTDVIDYANGCIPEFVTRLGIVKADTLMSKLSYLVENAAEIALRREEGCRCNK